MSLRLIKVKQRFKRDGIENIEATVRQELHGVGLPIPKGARIALAVGSRGITNIPIIIRTIAQFIRSMGAEPFLAPSMGSHGGATAEGQKDVLTSLGLSEEQTGVSVVSSMDVVEMPRGNLKCRVFMDKHAFDSDGVILVNRIKPHTDFHGPYESGLVKMCVIGLGKHRQALEIHRYGVEGLKDLTPAAAELILASGKILMGLAIVENACDETTLIKGLAADDIMREEPALLDLARKNMPSLPVDKLDGLLIDRQVKHLSGTGIDPNIIGRLKIRGQSEPEKPDIKSILVTDLTAESHGNAIGIGFADVVTRRLFDKIDFPATYENLITSTFLERGKIPLVADTSEKALAIALRACGPLPEGRERIIRIKDTLNLEELYVSQNIFEEIKFQVTCLGENSEIFDEDGELKPF